MRRDVVKSGRFEQRDRASKRRREALQYRRRPTGTQLDEVIARVLDGEDAVDLDEYLQRSSLLDVPASERLRRLAIAMEYAGLSWRNVRDAYERAVGYDAEVASVWVSWSVSALWYAEMQSERRDGRWIADGTLLSEAESAARTALEIGPRLGWAWRQLGMVLYAREDCDGALEAFRVAVEFEPEDAWAKLYVAHCLHDQERWEEALAAYDAVQLGAFRGPTSWRVDALKEQRAYCLLRTGEERAAHALIDEILRRYEAAPRLMLNAATPSLNDAIARLGDPTLDRRFEVVWERAVDDSSGRRKRDSHV